MANDVNIPAAPSLLPAGLQKKWEQAYVAGYKDAANDTEDESARHQAARREANRLLRMPELKSYDDAMALDAWQFLKREEAGGVLKVVTIDGKKYKFDAPKRSDKTEKPAKA